jgi:LysM repeat protein
LNNITNPNLIHAGTELTIAGCGSSTTGGGGAAAATTGGGGTHTVQAGENLFRIALRYGTTVQALQAANGLSGTTIYVGQQLIIP